MSSQDAPRYPMDPERLRRELPDGPGVYLFKEASGGILYVGKAGSLRKRVLSYFRKPSDLPVKTRTMLEKAAGLDVVLTATDQEALILENSLVRKWMPRYNILLRDDKHYPILRLGVQEPYPRLSLVRRIKKDGAVYFGPFSSAHAVRSTLRTIDRVFRLRKCKGRRPPKRSRPCLNFQMGRCLGPCTQPVSEADYARMVREVRMFLEGRSRDLLAELAQEMDRAAGTLDFERAAAVRDKIRAIEQVLEPQHMVSARLDDVDAVGLAGGEAVLRIAVLFVRNGYVTGTREVAMEGETGSEPEVMEAFLKQYYPRAGFIPKTILLSHPVEEAASLAAWLGSLCGKRVRIETPVRGERHALVRLAVENAEEMLQRARSFQEQKTMERLQRLLNLSRVPRLIEGVDISHLQGEWAVGSLVAFIDGRPQRSGYRNYRIRSVEGIDDYAMIGEVVARRLRKRPWPDLLLVDGGKGHLAAAKKALAEVWEGSQEKAPLCLVALAKAEASRGEKADKIYLPGRQNPVKIRADDPALHLLMRVRDEAHRRAVAHSRRGLRKRITRSDLDIIPGIGPKTRALLFRHFRGMEALMSASVRDLMEVNGLGKKRAETIRRHLDAMGGAQGGHSETMPRTGSESKTGA